MTFSHLCSGLFSMLESISASLALGQNVVCSPALFASKHHDFGWLFVHTPPPGYRVLAHLPLLPSWSYEQRSFCHWIQPGRSIVILKWLTCFVLDSNGGIIKVFGIYELVIFLVSGLIGKHLGLLGARNTLLCGIALTGWLTIVGWIQWDIVSLINRCHGHIVWPAGLDKCQDSIHRPEFGKESSNVVSKLASLGVSVDAAISGSLWSCGLLYSLHRYPDGGVWQDHLQYHLCPCSGDSVPGCSVGHQWIFFSEFPGLWTHLGPDGGTALVQLERLSIALHGGGLDLLHQRDSHQLHFTLHHWIKQRSWRRGRSKDQSHVQTSLFHTNRGSGHLQQLLQRLPRLVLHGHIGETCIRDEVAGLLGKWVIIMRQNSNIAWPLLGLSFTILGAVFGLMAPLVGLIVDRLISDKIMAIIGSICVLVIEIVILMVPSDSLRWKATT